jgi:hypothetical protein
LHAASNCPADSPAGTTFGSKADVIASSQNV